MSRRVVFTGLGTVSPLGLTVKETWDSCIKGISGVGPITLFDSTDWSVHISAEVKNFDPSKYMDFKEARRRDRFEQFGVAAAKEALADSGLEVTDANSGRIGVFVASAVGGLQAYQDTVPTMIQSGPRRMNP